MEHCAAPLFTESISGGALIEGDFSLGGRTFEPSAASAACAAGLQGMSPLLSIRHVSR
jgi:hypothetical protein